MTDSLSASALSVFLVMWVAIAVAVWRCFWRTRNAGFLWMGVAVVVWPIVDFVAECLLSYTMRQLQWGDTIWGMQPGEFMTQFKWANQLFGMGLLACAMTILASSFKRGYREPAAHVK